MTQIARWLLSGLVIAALSCTAVWAQATAQISGTVKDQSGAVLPGVEITATQTGTGISRTAVTNETGSFVLPSLPLGPYRVEAALPGFRTFVQTGIVLQVDSSTTINPVLEIGQVSETVEVQANAAQVETRSVGVSQVIETQRILELPLDGRQVENLITLSGAAVSSGTANTGGARAVGGQFISVAGGIASGVEYQLDGANHMNYAAGSGNALPFPDALQEFNVRTSGLTADAGRGAGVGAVTKSGTNQFHGDAFEFVRNDLFNAHEYFAVGKSTLKRNQYGGTVGGPVLKDRLFFFAGYQYTTLRSDPKNVQAWIPTPQMLAGDWTTFASAGCNNNRAITLRAPFVNNRIDPARFSQAAVKIVGLLPKDIDQCGLYNYGQRNIQNGPQLVLRMDHKLSNNHTLFGRYFAYSELNPTPYSSGGNILLAPVITDNRQAKSTTVGSTYVFGPRMINSFRASYNREMIHRAGNVWLKNGICDFGVDVYCGYTPTHMNLNISGGNAFNLAQTSRPDDILFTEGYDVGNDVNLVLTGHQITIGGGFNRTRHQASTSSKSPPELTFNNQNTGSGLGDFMTGQLFTLQQNAPNAHNPYRWFVRTYVSDAWKATSRLTVSYGVRWEPFIPEQRPNHTAYTFDLKRFEQGIKSSVYLNAPAGFQYYGDPGFPNGTAGVNKTWAQFSPRLGLAWDVTGDGKTSIRASYAYSYEVQPMQYTNNASSGSPLGGARVTITSPTGGFESPWRDVPGGNPFPLNITPNFIFPAFSELQTQPVNMKMPRTETWNLSIQRELPRETVLSVSYLGSLITQLPEQAPLNAATYIPGGPCVLPDGRTYNPCSTTATTDLRRRFSLLRYSDGKYMGLFSDLSPGSTQNYSGLITSIRTRPTKNTNINVNYTWSHCIGDPVNGFTSAGGAKADQTFSKAFDRKYDHGNCVLDRRQIFNLTTVLATPQFSGTTLRMLATGWRLSTIYRHTSGSPLAITTGQDNALTGISGQRPNLVGNAYTDTSTPLGFYLNRDAFALPATGTYGNLGNYSIVGPSTWDFDMALSRIFAIKESQSLEFRAEAFNVPNSFRPLNPNVTTTSSQFGQLRSARPPRIMQFALKYVF